VKRELARHGIRRVYASYGLAYRLTFETGEKVLASQPWNERFLHYPLPYLDEVRFSRNVGWLLAPDVPGELPAPAAFEEALGAASGTWKRQDLGGLTLFHGFAPPFGPRVSPLAAAQAAGDGKLDTVIAPAPDDAVTWPVTPPRPLAGITLVAGLSGLRLPRGFDLEVSADGATFERVVRRRRREERRDLRWVNGHPQYVIDDDLVAAALGGRVIGAVRLTPVEAGAWAVGEVLLHEADPAAAGSPLWDEWLDPDLSFRARREALAAHPRPDREDWYYRRLLAERARGVVARGLQ
jgi:hypothetical protein